jgi:hypothetical protein
MVGRSKGPSLGFTKRHLEEIESRGWSGSEQTVCSACLADEGLVAAVQVYGGTDVCSFCEGATVLSATAPLELVLELVVDGFRSEYEHPIEQAAYDSEDGYLVPTWDTWELLAEFEVTDRGDVIEALTGGVQADRVIVCARTAAPTAENRRHGISLFAVDTTSKGYTVGRKLDKLGLKTSDTAELSFVDVEVPVEDLLGVENAGFSHLAENLPRERFTIAMLSYAQASAAVEFAREYTTQRHAFGTPVASFQNTKFELAACKAEVDAMEAVVDRAIDAHDSGELTAADAASVKLFCTETAARVIDRCLQLHGGYGYMNEYPIARLYADNRVHRIYGGTSEVMKVIIAKDMGL